MITLNERYLTQINKIVEELENKGHSINIINEKDNKYERNPNWHTPHSYTDGCEYWDMINTIKKYEQT